MAEKVVGNFTCGIMEAEERIVCEVFRCHLLGQVRSVICSLLEHCSSRQEPVVHGYGEHSRRIAGMEGQIGGGVSGTSRQEDLWVRCEWQIALLLSGGIVFASRHKEACALCTGNAAWWSQYLVYRPWWSETSSVVA